MKEDFKIEMMDINKIIPYETNTKIHPEEQIKLIAASIDKFKFDQPIVIDEKNIIIKGHGRLLGAQYLKMKQVPVIIRTDMSEAEKIASRIADNKSNESEFDWGNIDLELEKLKEMKFDFDFGFEDSDFPAKEKEGLTDDDYIPEEVKPICKTGDLWQLGEHRLLCGDATKKADVKRLMGGEKADMVFTDPPYGVNYDGGHANEKRREKLKGDETTDLYNPCCKMAFLYSTNESSLYLWHAGVKGIAAAAAAAAAAAGYEIRCEIIWNKNQAQYGAISAQYKQKHEPCYYCYKKGRTVNWNGDTKQITVWDVDRSSKNEYHPTQKPVALAEKAIRNHKINSVMDLFLGSGSTLIACEKTNRKCFGMEIDQHYCDVIIKRWEEFTGQKVALDKK